MELDAGLGNRIQAVLSVFLLAMVTRRVFLIDWAVNTKAATLPSSELSSMPHWHALFMQPYPFLTHHTAFGGNVRRALLGPSRTELDLNGHANRYIDDGGGAYQSLLCENLIKSNNLNQSMPCRSTARIVSLQLLPPTPTISCRCLPLLATSTCFPHFFRTYFDPLLIF